eukprot:862307_1
MAPTSSPTESNTYSYLSSYQCEHTYMKCKENEDCQVDCGTMGCYHATIQAPINGNLSMNCSDRNSCHSTTIHGPENGDLNVYCFGSSDSYRSSESNCAYATIYGPTNGNLNIYCLEGTSEYESNCENANINAPSNGDLNLECNGPFACYSTVVDATNMISGSVHINPFNSNAMPQSTIKCPLNGNECKISCINSTSCQSMNVYCQGNSSCSIIASGSGALESSKIYCEGNSSCSIIASGSGSGIISDLFVYSIYGFSHQLLQLQCNYGTNISNCYSESLP